MKHEYDTEIRDAMGRSSGFMHVRDGIVQHTVLTDYASDGRINSAGFVHEGVEKVVPLRLSPWLHLLHCLTHPNGVTLMQTYEAKRDLMTEMLYINGNSFHPRPDSLDTNAIEHLTSHMLGREIKL